MTLIEIAELNGAAGNQDYFAKSQQAEQLILSSVSRLIRRPIHSTTVKGVHRYDFSTDKKFVGDVKIWSGSELCVEIQQQRGSRVVDGWFTSYLAESEFAGLFAINHWHSVYHNRSVFKLRWIVWHSLIDWVFAHPEQVRTNQHGSYMPVDPMMIQHVYLGDFFAVDSKYGSDRRAFDVSVLHANPELNIQQLYNWF
jgi:hypothetical protein